MEMGEIRCIVIGKVQGVFYRDFVMKHARHLALTGYVRNTPDFTLEIIAQGFHDDLEKFLEHVRRGPFLARVSRCDAEWRDPAKPYASFEVVF